MPAIECLMCKEIINWSDRLKHKCKLTAKQEDYILEQGREKDYERKEAYANMQLEEGEVKTDE